MLGNQHALRDLPRLITQNNSSLLFICETKLQASQCHNLANRFQFNDYFSVDCNRRSGRLTLLRRDPLKVSIRSFSSGNIDFVVKHGLSHCRFIGFYGNLVVSLHIISWKVLR